MAIQEHDREDLLGECRNMPWRGRCVIDDVEVVIGFRSGGQMSLFCGVDPVFQFNASRELRRVFFQANRYRAENGQLIAMTRESRGGRVRFMLKPIDSTVQAGLMRALDLWLDLVRAGMDSSSWRVEGESVDDFQSRLRDWFAGLPDPVVIAAVPNVGEASR